MRLKKEFDYFLTHKEELLSLYKGKYLIIKNELVLGAYDTETEAVKETLKTQELGTFLVQKCEPGSDSYTQHFHSRAAFA